MAAGWFFLGFEHHFAWQNTENKCQNCHLKDRENRKSNKLSLYGKQMEAKVLNSKKTLSACSFKFVENV